MPYATEIPGTPQRGQARLTSGYISNAPAIRRAGLVAARFVLMSLLVLEFIRTPLEVMPYPNLHGTEKLEG
jgi:hypothetical protein